MRAVPNSDSSIMIVNETAAEAFLLDQYRRGIAVVEFSGLEDGDPAWNQTVTLTIRPGPETPFIDGGVVGSK